MNSMPQHDSPSGSGHTLFLRHQFAIDWTVLSRNEPSLLPWASRTSAVAAGLVAWGCGGHDITFHSTDLEAGQSRAQSTTPLRMT